MRNNPENNMADQEDGTTKITKSFFESLENIDTTQDLVWIKKGVAALREGSDAQLKAKSVIGESSTPLFEKEINGVLYKVYILDPKIF